MLLMGNRGALTNQLQHFGECEFKFEMQQLFRLNFLEIIDLSTLIFWQFEFDSNWLVSIRKSDIVARR